MAALLISLPVTDRARGAVCARKRRDGENAGVPTRVLIALALACGLAILVAFAVQVLLASRAG